MTFVIATLLALILVAMVSSNQAAATGVWMVVRFVLWGIAALIGWGILVGYSVWFYQTYPPAGEWKQILGIAVSVVFPPLWLWFVRKEIAKTWTNDRRAALKFGAFCVAYIVGIMVLGIVVAEVEAAYEYGGWAMVLVPLAVTCAILLWRSLTGSKGWHEVWFGPHATPEPWTVVVQEQDAFDLVEFAASEKVDEMWDEMTLEERNTWRDGHQARVMSTKVRLEELRKKLEAEKKVRLKDESWSVMGFFWLFFVFALFGLVGILWDIGFAYAMELRFVKGQAWLARAVVVVSGLAIAGLLFAAGESINDVYERRKLQKAGGIKD